MRTEAQPKARVGLWQVPGPWLLSDGITPARRLWSHGPTAWAVVSGMRESGSGSDCSDSRPSGSWHPAVYLSLVSLAKESFSEQCLKCPGPPRQAVSEAGLPALSVCGVCREGPVFPQRCSVWPPPTRISPGPCFPHGALST